MRAKAAVKPPAKRKRGRPPLPPGKKAVQLKISIPGKYVAFVRERAKYFGVSPSRYIGQLVENTMREVL